MSAAADALIDVRLNACRAVVRGTMRGALGQEDQEKGRAVLKRGEVAAVRGPVAQSPFKTMVQLAG